MGRDTRQLYCHDCGQRRLFETQTPNHILHFLLMLLTAGLWFPVWVLCIMSNCFVPYRCTQCGGKARQ